MAGSFHSAQWYRVADLKLQLRGHARIFRTHFRGQLWYVLQDRTSGRFHRFTPASYFLLSLLDGSRTVEEAWDIACKQLDEDALSQDEVIRLLGQLHASDVLLGNVPPDIEEMADRGRKGRSKRRMMSVMNPLAIRIPLLDPEGFLSVTMPLVRPLLSIFGLVLWLGLIGYALTLAALNWDGLSGNVLDRVLTAQSLMLLLLAYPFVKILHELGHAYAIKRWGGEVHEIGTMLLVFMPVPYVDASDSLSFQSKWQRAFVAGAGIIVEASLAAIALIVWDHAESGMVRAFAYNIILIGGVSTLFFNGNPLLRFDGYYVLSDILEIPNLGKRSNQYLGYLIQSRMLGVEDAHNPATAPGEAGWFVFYSIASFIYRMFIFSAIVLLVASKFFSLGILLAIWTVTLMFGVPIAKHIWFLFTSPVLRRNRGKALARVGGVLGVILVFGLLQPIPYSTMAEGVVWVPREGTIHAGVNGTVVEVNVTQGQEVKTGDLLMRLEDPLLDARVILLTARTEELRRRLDEVLVSDPARANIAREELTHADADRALALERQEALNVRAATDGRVALLQTVDLPGQFVRQGDLLGYVSTFQDPVIRAVVPENDADLVRQETDRIDMRFVRDPETVFPVQIAREVPTLTGALPSMALSTQGGGNVVMDPSSPGGARALENLLQLEIQAAPGLTHPTIGDRVYLRFVHRPTPIVQRAYRRVRQIFLSQFQI